MPLIFRIVKGEPLTFLEGDNNLRYLETLAVSASNSFSNWTGSSSSQFAGTASLSLTASYALNAGTTVDTGSLVSTESFNAFTSSYNTGSFTGSFIGDLIGTASYINLSAGPGIIINGLEITSSVRTVNGIFPTNGNIPVALSSTITGTSASLASSGSGNITGSIPDGLVWIISNDPTPSNNGDVYIYSSGSVGAWYPVAPLDQAASDARYIKLDGANTPMTGDLNMGGNNINNVGTMNGTASYATSASFAISASWAPPTIVDTGSLLTTSSFNAFTSSYNTGSFSGSFTGQLIGTASWATNAITASFALATATAPASDRIVTSNITASVSTATGSIFAVASGSSTLLNVSSSGTLVLSSSVPPSRNITIDPTNQSISSFSLLLECPSTFRLRTTAANSIILNTNNNDRWYIEPTGQLTTAVDNIHDIGLSGSRRPRNIYAAGTGSVFGALDITFGSTNALRTFPSTGNVFIGSTPTDGGFKLEVAGTTRLGGSTSLSIPDWTLADSSGIFRMRLNTTSTRLFGTNGNSIIGLWSNPTSTQPGITFDNIIANNTTNITATRFTTNYTGNLGSSTQNLLEVVATGSVSSTALLRHLYINPNTSGFLSERSIETVKGDVMLGTSGIGSVYIGTSTTSSFKLDVSGSGRFTDGLTVTGSFTVVTGSSREFQVRNTGVDIGSVVTDVHTVTGSLNVSGSITASLFGTASFALATATPPASDRIVTSDITASVSTATGSIFSVASGSSTLFRVSSSGDLLVGTGSATANIRGFQIELNSTNGVVRLIASTANSVHFGTNNIVRWSVDGATNNFIAAADNLYDIGARTTTRPRNIYAAGTGSVFAALDITSGSVNALRTFPSTGNTFLGSTPVDGGFKLDVNGTARIQTGITLNRNGSAFILYQFNDTQYAQLRGNGSNQISVTDGGGDFVWWAFSSNATGSGEGNSNKKGRWSVRGANNPQVPAIYAENLNTFVQDANNEVIRLQSQVTSAQMIDGYGGNITLYNSDIDNVDNHVATIGWRRMGGSDNSGGITFATANAGTITEAARITHLGNVLIGAVTESGDRLFVSGSGRFTGGLTVTGSATITDVLTLPFQDPLPSGKPTGSIALSGSGATYAGMFVYDGTNWVTA